jgi:hypothetical protein
MTDAHYPARGAQMDANKTPAEGVQDERLEAWKAMFASWRPAMLAKWSQWREEAKRDYDFAAGHQWDPDDRDEMEANQKIPVVFNLTAPTLDAVGGAEIQNRQQVQYYPREVGDQGVNDVLTQGAQYISDQTDGDMEDSEAFYDTLICGVGWTEQRPEVEGQDSNIVRERTDPLQIMVDPSSRKACFEDKRYLCREIPMSRDEYDDFVEEIDRPDLVGTGDGVGLGDGKRLTVVNPRQRYTNGMLGTGDNDEVVVCEWQWWEKEPVFVTPLPDPENAQVTKLVPLNAKQWGEAKKIKPDLPHSKSSRKVYYRAICGEDDEILHWEEMPEQAFRYGAITGKRDRNAGTWFGLVRAMRDPQRFTNKLYSEILNIVRNNANGGMAMEEDAVNDPKQFEESWAQTNKITWMRPGAISNPNGQKIIPKTPVPVQPTLFQLMQFAREMVQACTGVNEEILGLVGREQPGVLEAQRKQAAYGILSAFFDSKRRYQRNLGRLTLAQMREFLPADKLVRIVDKGSSQYVQLAYTLDAQEYDVVVDEAPAGPNAKDQVAKVLMPLIFQLLESGLVGPEELATAIQFLPLPAAVSNGLAAAITKRAQEQKPDPLQEEAAKVEIENTKADTVGKQAKAFKDVADARTTHAKLGAAFVETATAMAGPEEEPDENQQAMDATQAQQPVADETGVPQVPGAAPGDQSGQQQGGMS